MQDDLAKSKETKTEPNLMNPTNNSQMGKGTTTKAGENLSLGTIVVIVISFVFLIIAASIGTYVSYRPNINYANIDSEKAIKGTYTTLVALSALMPLLYFLFHYTKTTNNTGKDVKQSKENLLAVAYISFVFILLACSLGIWLCLQTSSTNIIHNYDGSINPESFTRADFKNNANSAYEIVFITFLVVGIFLPILYSMFYFKDQIFSKATKV